MQFIRNGPQVPERLLQAHEDGRVVFFCGAGISVPAGLPDFQGLVRKLYRNLSVTPDSVQKAAICAGQFDTAIGLLEQGVFGGREKVRREIASILSPGSRPPAATETHRSLLKLGKVPGKGFRLVTTNFDGLFETAIGEENLTVERFPAPAMPNPKERWYGLVYLHGHLPEKPNESDLERLVLSSGDFGSAYLTNGWAARFVSELLRNYTVCFVGYGINDPVLRYMIDAQAEDRLRGESPLEIFAFGGFASDEEKVEESKWRAKGATPVLYLEEDNHVYLHETLLAWANMHREGREPFVVKHAHSVPQESTQQDDFVGRILWALDDASGGPARCFANLDPVPPLDWLETFSERHRQTDDGECSGDSSKTVGEFSLICRPCPPGSMAATMRFVDAGPFRCHWDKVMWPLAHWLVRHLNDPDLLFWLVDGGAQLHDELRSLVEDRLDKLAKLERAGDNEELARITRSAPNAVPSPPMRTLWQLLLAGRMRARSDGMELHRWLDRLNLYGLTTSLRLELRELLTPRISLRKPFGWTKEERNRATERINDLVDSEIVFSDNLVHHRLKDAISGKGHWAHALPQLLMDFTGLLRDALDLMRELGDADERRDLSFIHQPSISAHAQNSDFEDWTVLIELIREAWLATLRQSPSRAARVAESWWNEPYPLFRRLALFAATESSAVPNRRALDWLLGDERHWLWSIHTEREVMRLLDSLAPSLGRTMLEELEQAVLGGPTRSPMRDGASTEDWAAIVDRDVWLRLTKMQNAGAELGLAAQTRLTQIAARNTEWKLAENQRDEFPIWEGGFAEMVTGQPAPPLPSDSDELIEWLKLCRNAGRYSHVAEQWKKYCGEHFDEAAVALGALAKDGDWLTDRWGEALQAGAEDSNKACAWQCLAPLLIDARDVVLEAFAFDVSRWLQDTATTTEEHQDLFLALAKRLLTLKHAEDAFTDCLVTQAINHPVGIVTQALVRWVFRVKRSDNECLPEEVTAMMDSICNDLSEGFKHGRVMLASQSVPLFRIDPTWTKENLLPHFNWERSDKEARGAWEGFLRAPRWHPPLMVEIREYFLTTATHYEALESRMGRQYVSLLTFAALGSFGSSDVISEDELAAATGALPPEGLHHAARVLVRAMKGVRDQHSDYWANRVRPYIKKVWPPQKGKFSAGIVAQAFGELCVAAQGAFPCAFQDVKYWLGSRPENPAYLIHELSESDHCASFPDTALRFLNLVIVGDQPTWLLSDLRKCLEEILKSKPELKSDDAYVRLRQML